MNFCDTNKKKIQLFLLYYFGTWKRNGLSEGYLRNWIAKMTDGHLQAVEEMANLKTQTKSTPSNYLYTFGVILASITPQYPPT